MKFINWLKSKYSNKKHEIELIPVEIRLSKKIDLSNGNLTSDFEEKSYKAIRDFTEREIIDFIYQQKDQKLLYRELGFLDSQ